MMDERQLKHSIIANASKNNNNSSSSSSSSGNTSSITATATSNTVSVILPNDNTNKRMTIAPISAPPSSERGAENVASVPCQSQVALKCPRCDSSNTKFCYYNNYSLSQPRHFCKGCKRYWTRGGTLRNVPVGGGCRKNKRVKKPSSSSSLVPTNHLLPIPSSTPQLDAAMLYALSTDMSIPHCTNTPFDHLNALALDFQHNNNIITTPPMPLLSDYSLFSSSILASNKKIEDQYIHPLFPYEEELQVGFNSVDIVKQVKLESQIDQTFNCTDHWQLLQLNPSLPPPIALSAPDSTSYLYWSNPGIGDGWTGSASGLGSGSGSGLDSTVAPLI